MHIRKIYLSWRPGVGESRFIVGLFQRNVISGVEFNYYKDTVKLAKKAGFNYYAGLSNIDKKYTENDGISNILKNRIIDRTRPDSVKYLSFWEADNSNFDEFDILALTQGWIPTDNFEFLGVYYPEKNFSFVTDLASVRKRNLSNSDITESEYFRFEREPNNQHDKHAVKILNSNNLTIGYIKQIHNRFFYNLRNSRPLLTLRAVEKNSIIKRVFLKISIQ